MLGRARNERASDERAENEQAGDGPRRAGGQTASAGLVVAVGTGAGNVLAYGFNLVLSRGLGPSGYAELGTLLSVFLIGTVPGLAVQAINARRLAVVAEASPEARAALVRGLRRRGLAVGAGVAAVFVALAPAIAALLPSVTVGGVAWTGVSLAANTVFASYLGIAQGTSRFMTMTVLYLAAQGSRLTIGAVAASAQVSPTTVMAAQTAAWAFAAVAGRWLLRDVAGVEPEPGDVAGVAAQAGSAAAVGPGSAETAGSPAVVGSAAAWQDTEPHTGHHGYVSEVLRATGGLGGILLLTVLDTLLASRYLTDGGLGRYNTGALLARAAFFAPSFVALLAYPRLARPGERRRALLTALALTGGIGVLGVAIAGVGRDPLIRVAFGAKYATPGGFDLGADGWVFASVGALLALVNLALLDGVARRSHAVSAVVLGGIVLETTVIVGFAHGSAAAIVTAAAACALATATVSVCLTARTAVEVVAETTDVEDAQAVGAVAQST
jgi:hypothetical protein